jgi:hypothetical protein
MENIEISGHTELIMQIMHLKQEKFRQEDELKYTFKEFVFTLNPISMVKNSLHDLAQDSEVQFDMAKVGMNMGANYIIERILGKNSSFKGFLSALIVEKVSAALINTNLTKIISGIRKLTHRNSNNE